MSQFKFIHAADLHIESPYKGVRHMNKALGDALVNHGIRAYEKIIQSGIDEQIDFMLIAGDSFDSESGSLSAQYRFVRGLERLNSANIPVFIICGNHDPLNSWSTHLQLPANVVLFDADKVQQHTVMKDGNQLAEIYGVSFGKKEEYNNLAKEFKRNDKASFSIGLLHGTVAGNDTHTPYCKFEMDNLRASNLDYWALGHIHKREVLSEQSPMAVYPGNIQGRHFNETGEKGCSLVTVNQGKIISHDFISLSDIIYEYRTIDVAGMINMSDFFEAVNALKQELIASGKSYLLRLQLKGKTNLHTSFSKREEIERLIKDFNSENNYHTDFVYIDKFILQTTPEIDLESRKQTSDFIGDLIQRFEYYASDEEALLALKDNLLTELSSSKVGRGLKDANFEEELNKELHTILTNAKWKCIDGLIQNGSEI